MSLIKITDEKIYQVFVSGSSWSTARWCCSRHQDPWWWWWACHPLAPPTALGSMVESWSGLGQAGEDNVVMLPGVSLAEAQEFVDILYDREVVNNEHFAVIEDTGVIDKDVLNNNDSVDIKLEPHEILWSRFPVIIVKKYSTTRKLSIITFMITTKWKRASVIFDFLCWEIMSLTDQNCVDWRWALSFAQHTPVSVAFKNQTTLCYSMSIDRGVE